jgi:hypothetical protein
MEPRVFRPGDRSRGILRTMASDPALSGRRELLRHAVATLAYRAQKALDKPPVGFADFRVSPASRTPLEIVSHLGDLMRWAERMARGEYKWTAEPATDWQTASDGFFAGLAALDAALQTATFTEYAPEVVFQGAIADALTHVGQLTLLRGAAGAAIRPESYARAEIEAGRVGRNQSATRREFEGDASAKPR